MENVYIFFDDCTKVDNETVFLRDIASVYCRNKAMRDKINALRIYTFHNAKTPKRNEPDSSDDRIIITALKIFEIILSEYPDVNIIPTGSTDIIIEKKQQKAFPGMDSLKGSIYMPDYFFRLRIYHYGI